MTFVVGPVEECASSRLSGWGHTGRFTSMSQLTAWFMPAASLGFASLENLFYVLEYGPEVMIARAPLSTVGHLVFGSIWGYALGQYYISDGRKKSLLLGSLAMAAAAHSLYNIFAFSFLPGAVALIVLGGIWSYRVFRIGIPRFDFAGCPVWKVRPIYGHIQSVFEVRNSPPFR